MDRSNPPLQLNDTGTYGELAARPNPEGLIILSESPFEGTLSVLAHRLGRALTQDEVAAELLKTPAIAVTKETAEQTNATRAKRWLS